MTIASGEDRLFSELERAGLELVRSDDGLMLTDGALQLCADFSDMRPRLSPHKLGKELLVRAAKVKGVDRPMAIDATAGLGEDAFLLAAAGFEVICFERDPAIASMLISAHEKALEDKGLFKIASRMQVIEGDSLTGLAELSSCPDVVYLDPMFPERSKSAAVKKKFQLLQRLEAPAIDGEALFEAACAVHPKKIIVKRPLKGPYLGYRKPSYSLRGKAIRFDVYSGEF